MMTKKPSSSSTKPADLASDLQIAITDFVVDDLANSIRRQLDTTLAYRIRQAVVRSTTRAMTMKMTSILSYSLSRVLNELLSLSLTQLSTEKITSSLVPTLTASIVPILTRALSQSPTQDFYCYYCAHQGVYCDECQTSQSNAVFRDSIGVYYGEYYSSYYSQYYSTTGSDEASKEYYRQGGRVI